MYPLYISRKNDWPLKEAHALVIDMCAGKLEWPNIPASTIVLVISVIESTSSKLYSVLPFKGVNLDHCCFFRIQITCSLRL